MQPFNFIASFLGLKQGNSTSDDSVGSANASQGSASCQGWSRPDPAVRLRFTGNDTVRIFGFPQEKLPDALEKPLPNFGTIGRTPLLYLRTNVPAYVSYVMGSDWRSKLRDDHFSDARHMWRNGRVILRPSAEEIVENEKLARKEQAHYERMLRCEPKVIRSKGDTAPPRLVVDACDNPSKQVFGWPSGGGVWILRRSTFLDNPRASYLSGTYDDDIDSATRRRKAEVLYNELVTSRKEYADMDELCRALEDAGAEFYPSIHECPEAVELGLVGSDHISDSGPKDRGRKAISHPSAAPADKKRIKELAPTAELAAEEQAHCIRMLRCGARAILSEVDADITEWTAGGGPDIPKQIFGWPSNGGVWILRKPGGNYLKVLQEYFRFCASMSQYTDMDALCRALEETGGVYYAAVEDCFEAVELGLHKI